MWLGHVGDMIQSDQMGVWAAAGDEQCPSLSIAFQRFPSPKKDVLGGGLEISASGSRTRSLIVPTVQQPRNHRG